MTEPIVCRDGKCDYKDKRRFVDECIDGDRQKFACTHLIELLTAEHFTGRRPVESDRIAEQIEHDLLKEDLRDN